MTKVRMKKINTLMFLAIISAQVYADEISSKIIDDAALKKAGYITTRYTRYNGTVCDQYEGDLKAVKNYQSIKAIHPITAGEPVYIRFTIIKEAYKTQDLALRRLAQLTRPFKFKTGSWYSKTCSMKEGFHIGSDVYFVATDAGMFRDHIPGFIVHLKQILKETGQY
ncbi:MAG TPA: hypothetical protein ENJ08_13155 [Gammaproteobacteria bacterium]|nr:hypothetical protein [Gammaproteobacteria bacterium]